MTAQIVLAFFACSTAAAQVAPGQTLLLQPALEQPVERTGLGVAGEPAAPARGWSLTPGGEPDATLPDIVATQGPGVRVRTESAVTVFRPRWRLAGDFAVSAVFQAGAGMPAPYGLTVGGTALLIRSDGAYAIQVSGTGAPIWSPVGAPVVAGWRSFEPSRDPGRVRGGVVPHQRGDRRDASDSARRARRRAGRAHRRAGGRRRGRLRRPERDDADRAERVQVGRAEKANRC